MEGSGFLNPIRSLKSERLNMLARISKFYSDKELKDKDFMQAEAAKAGVAAAKDNFAGALMTHLHFKELVRRLERKERVLPIEFELERGDLPAYKHHPLKGRLIHWAVWQVVLKEDQGLKELRLVLEARAAIDSSASYYRHNKKTKSNELVALQAVHLASGWGCVPALQALAEAVKSDEEKRKMVNCFCLKAHVKYYTPLHDAAFCGQKEAVVWLLENGANPQAQNIEGFTPLHWLAFTGLEPSTDLEVVVRALIKYQARLDEMTEPNNSLGLEGIPMEIAAMAASNYPNHLMYLLAPSFQAFEAVGGASGGGQAGAPRVVQATSSLPKRQRSVFEDLSLLCRRNHQAAVAFANEIVGTSAPELKSKVMYDSQQRHTVDQLTAVFQAAPQAAANVFHLLVSDPHIQSKGHHPISTRANLRRWMVEQDMICDYQTDVFGDKDEKHEAGQPILPLWDCQGNGGHPAWHDNLIRQSKGTVDVEVTTKVVVIPNILTLDLLMSFSEVPDESIGILGDVPVRGAINCLWQKLVWLPFVLLIVFNFMDWLALFAWGWATSDDALSRLSVGFDYAWDRTSTENSPLQRPLCWTVIAAGLGRDFCNSMWHIHSYVRNWMSHRDGRALGGALWTLPVEMMFWFLRIVFLIKTWELDDRLMTSDEQSWLAAVFLAQSANMMVMFRVTAISGKRILSIMHTLFSRNMLEMMAVMVAVFLAIVGALVIVHRSQSAVWVATVAYVGLSFGEGDNLAAFGLDPSTHETTPLLEIIIVFFGGIVFNIVLLNLLIALFANEYDKVEKISENHFCRERARVCCWCMLALQKVRLMEGGGTFRSWFPRIAGLISLTASFVLQAFVSSATDAPARAALCCFSAAGLSLWQVAILAQLMQSEWFVDRADGKVGPVKDHFLWICHRADLLDHHHSTELQKMEARLRESLTNRFEHALRGQTRNFLAEQNQLSAKIDALAGATAKLDALLRHFDIQPPAGADQHGGPTTGDSAAAASSSSRPGWGGNEAESDDVAQPSPGLRESPVWNAAEVFKGKLRLSRQGVNPEDLPAKAPVITVDTPPQNKDGQPGGDGSGSDPPPLFHSSDESSFRPTARSGSLVAPSESGQDVSSHSGRAGGPSTKRGVRKKAGTKESQSLPAV